jgi:hypothetical protein
VNHDALKWLHADFETAGPGLYEPDTAERWRQWWEGYRVNGDAGLAGFPRVVLPTVLLRPELANDQRLQEMLLRDTPGDLRRLGAKLKAAITRVTKCLDAFVQRPDLETRDKCLVSFKRLRGLLEQCPRSVVFPQ